MKLVDNRFKNGFKNGIHKMFFNTYVIVYEISAW